MKTPGAQTYWIRPCTRIWLLLMGLSYVTYLVGASAIEGLWAALLVLGFAILKGQLIGDFYMGLRWVSGLWRWVIALWLIVPGVLIATAFVLAAKGGT
jgi:cytochrome c oxidase subunit IV